VAGAPLTEVLDYASTTAEIDYAKYLGYAGLALELPPAVDEPRITPLPNPTPQQQAVLNSWLGDPSG
jgi:hypothetical protein